MTRFYKQRIQLPWKYINNYMFYTEVLKLVNMFKFIYNNNITCVWLCSRLITM